MMYLVRVTLALTDFQAVFVGSFLVVGRVALKGYQRMQVSYYTELPNFLTRAGATRVLNGNQ